MVVFKRLLDWIDRCDIASQAGQLKPKFKTTDGESIFPADDEEQWWLTDISKRISVGDDKDQQHKQQEGDEDGPATCDEESEQREVSDEDPVSEPEVLGEGNASSSSDQHRLQTGWWN